MSARNRIFAAQHRRPILGNTHLYFEGMPLLRARQLIADFVSNRFLIIAPFTNADHIRLRQNKTTKTFRSNLEDTMRKTLITAAAVLALSLGSIAAQAGGATSAPTRSNHVWHTNNQQTQTAGAGITEFSSSSARSSVAKR